MLRLPPLQLPAFARKPAEKVGLLIDAESYFREFYRAASTATHSILLSGWQFDSKVDLLRGADAAEARGPTTLLAFLNSLCEHRPSLTIKIMAWDFHLVFAAEREWMQRIAFDWMTHERLTFQFDSNHVSRGCHHQKFVIIDGQLSFLGGLDLCDHRWDTRDHKQTEPLRTSRGEPHQPFHDIQAVVQGREVASELERLFACRWERAGGAPLPAELLVPPEPATPFYTISNATLDATEVHLSRTDPQGSPDGCENCTEVRDLYLAAIASAQSLIYVETQYFSSHAIADALVARMHAVIPGRTQPQLEIVLILNMEGETLKEHVALGLAQAQIIGRLRDAAHSTGHRLGVYYTQAACESGEEPTRATYIHSKIMIVDDALLSVGSANLTNRSMDVDTELNLTVQAEDADSPLIASVQRARASLLAEHTGADVATVDRAQGLVDALDRLASLSEARAPGAPWRLRHHPSPTPEEQRALALVDPQTLPFDPDEEDLRRGPGGPLSRSIRHAVRELLGDTDKG